MTEYKDTSTDISQGLRKRFPLWYQNEDEERRGRHQFYIGFVLSLVLLFLWSVYV